MINSRINHLFDNADVLVKQYVDDKSDVYKLYSLFGNKINRRNSNIQKSYILNCPTINIKSELMNVSPDGFDDGLYAIMQEYASKLQDSRVKPLINQKFDKSKLEKRIERAKNWRYPLATSLVFFTSAAGMSLGINYLAQTYEIEMLNFSTIPLFLGTFIATIPTILETWYRPVGRLLMLDLSSSRIKGTEEYESNLRSDYMRKANSYLKTYEYNLINKKSYGKKLSEKFVAFY
jgi:hypothetical protein